MSEAMLYLKENQDCEHYSSAQIERVATKFGVDSDDLWEEWWGYQNALAQREMRGFA